METGVVEYNVTEAEISKMKDLYLCLKIDDLEDKDQFDAVHSARMVVKGKRVEVEKRRKELKASALEWGKKVDGKAKEIFSMLEPIESHLEFEEKKVTDEQKRIKAEEEARQKAIVEARINALMKVNCIMSFPDVAVLSDDEYENLYQTKEGEWGAEQVRIAAEKEAEEKRKAEEAAARKAEDERLAKIAAEQKAEAERLAKIKAEQEAKERALKEQQEKLERAEFERKAREQAKIDAENERIEAEQKAQAKAAMKAIEDEERKIAAENEAKRLEALKPDKEKILYWLERIETAVDEYPKVNDEELGNFIGYGREILGTDILSLREGIND